jgi:CDP-glucose 4,6-dehydratase
VGRRAGALEGLGLTGFWRDRPTLVTGATGFLGSWLVRRLVELGAAPVCLVRDWTPESELVSQAVLPRVRVVRGDVRRQALLERVLGEYEIDTVFHLAAQTVVGIANRNPGSTFDSNVRGTWALLEACRRSPCVRQAIVASSDKAYGAHDRLPYEEDAPLRPRHPYDVSKACADLIARCYADTFGLPVVVSRCGNLYGGGDLNWSRLVPGTVRSVLRGERPLVRSDGRSVRDYLYVEDAVRACLALAQGLAARRELAGEAFNFGHRTPVAVAAVVREILRACGREDLEPDIRMVSTHEIAAQFVDPGKAHRLLGWEPAFGLADGLARTIGWYRRFLDAGDGHGR